MKKIFIGIDFSKKKFDATAIFAENQFTQCRKSVYQTFRNNREGFRNLMDWTARIAPGADKDDFLFCGENTGIYSEFLSTMLSAEDFTMWLENPLQIKRSMGIQRIKNDKADSAAIAEYAMRFQDKCVAYIPLKDSLKSLQEIFKYRAQLVREKHALKVRCKEKLSTDAKPSKALKFMRHSSSMIVGRIDKEIEKCEKEMEKIIKEDEELKRTFDIVTSIKGVALQNAAVLLVVTNNFQRFDYDARKLACFYGVAPFGKESGTSVHTAPHTSCFADSLLKSLITEAAKCAIVRCDELREYYQRLIARGKKRMVALNNVKNKMLHIIMAMVKSGKRYAPDYKMQLALQYIK